MINKSTSSTAGAPHRVALLGGRKAGKTSLYASLHQSLIASANGFSPTMIARFPDGPGLHQLEALFAEKFASPGMSFRAEQSGPLRSTRIGIDFSSSKWFDIGRSKHQLRGYYDIQIDDLRDDYDLFGQFAARPTANSFTREENNSTSPLQHFEQSLNAANALVICQPAGQRLAPSEATGFIRLMSDIGVGRYGSFETIVVAFTKYERLFTRFGVDAFRMATRPETIIDTLRATIQQDDSLASGLTALNSDDSETPHLYALPVSSFGFLRENGAPNYDRQTERPIAALAPQIETAQGEAGLQPARHTANGRMKVAGFTVPVAAPAQSAAEQHHPHPSPHWLPFLTADPILTAISGVPSQFMLPLSEFLLAINNGSGLRQQQRIA